MRIAFLLYDQLTQLDMTGPAQVLSRMPGAQVDYVAKTTVSYTHLRAHET